MTRDELITVSTQELGKLPADELEIIARHFETKDRALLAQRLAEEAEEMWSGDHEAPVPQNEWPSAHLQLVLGMHRDDKREALLAEQRRIVSEVIDGQEPARRALLCWRFHTTVQRRVVALVTSATVRAMEDNLVKLTSFKEAAKAVIDFEIELQIDEIEDHYYHGSDPRVSTASDPAPRELDPSMRAVIERRKAEHVSDEDAAAYDPNDPSNSASSVSGPRDLAASAITAPANDPPVREQHVAAPGQGEETTPLDKPPSSHSPTSDEVLLAAARASRGELPDTIVEFAAYDPIARRERQGESTDEAMATELVRRVKERIARGHEPEVTVLAVFGDDYVSTRTEAILLRQAGWDAIPLLLDKPALAVLVGGAVVAVRDTMGRLAVHPMRSGTLNHLYAGVSKVEARTLDLRDAINIERNTPERLARFAMELWASAREPAPAGPTTPRRSKSSDGLHSRRGGGHASQSMERPISRDHHRSPAILAQSSGIAMAAGGVRRSVKPTRGRTDWDAIAAEAERRVFEKESELVATMDRLTRIYSGGRLAGRRVRPGTIVVERVSDTPEFPSLVLPNLASIADGFDVGAAVAIVGLMPLAVALAGWVDPGVKPTPEGDRLTAALEGLGAAYRAGQASQEEFEATRDALWEEAERAGVAVEIAWLLHTKWGGSMPREPAVATSLRPVPVRAMPHYRYLLELNLRQIPSDAHASVISRWVRPSHDQIEAGQGAWQHVLELVRDHSTCSQCPFVLGSNLDCETCRTWVLSLKRPGAPWTAERIGAALYNCDEPAVATAAMEALAQSTQAPLTAAFFREFADNFEARLTKHVRPEDMDPGYRDHCRRAVEWLLPQPDFPLPKYPPSKGAPRSFGLDILMRAAPVSAGWRF